MSFEEFLVNKFKDGVVRLNCELHVTPHSLVKLRLISNKVGYFDELEMVVKNNQVVVIDNHVENKP